MARLRKSMRPPTIRYSCTTQHFSVIEEEVKSSQKKEARGHVEADPSTQIIYEESIGDSMKASLVQPLHSDSLPRVISSESRSVYRPSQSDNSLQSNS